MSRRKNLLRQLDRDIRDHTVALEELLRDFRYGLRTLRRNPGFATIAIFTLALGIDVNGAIFTVLLASWGPALKAALLDPLAALRYE